MAPSDAMHSSGPPPGPAGSSSRNVEPRLSPAETASIVPPIACAEGKADREAKSRAVRSTLPCICLLECGEDLRHVFFADARSRVL